MKKSDILKTFDIASLVSIVLATLLVVIYQFVGEPKVIKFAMIMYCASFLIYVSFFSAKTYFVFKQTKEDGKVMFDISKKEKAFMLTKLVLSVLAFAFTLTILVLY